MGGDHLLEISRLRRAAVHLGAQPLDLIFGRRAREPRRGHRSALFDDAPPQGIALLLGGARRVDRPQPLGPLGRAQAPLALQRRFERGESGGPIVGRNCRRCARRLLSLIALGRERRERRMLLAHPHHQRAEPLGERALLVAQFADLTGGRLDHRLDHFEPRIDRRARRLAVAVNRGRGQSPSRGEAGEGVGEAGEQPLHIGAGAVARGGQRPDLLGRHVDFEQPRAQAGDLVGHLDARGLEALAQRCEAAVFDPALGELGAELLEVGFQQFEFGVSGREGRPALVALPVRIGERRGVRGRGRRRRRRPLGRMLGDLRLNLLGPRPRRRQLSLRRRPFALRRRQLTPHRRQLGQRLSQPCVGIIQLIARRRQRLPRARRLCLDRRDHLRIGRPHPAQARHRRQRHALPARHVQRRPRPPLAAEVERLDDLRRPLGRREQQGTALDRLDRPAEGQRIEHGVRHDREIGALFFE